MMPEIASRPTASTNVSVQHRQWAVEMTLSIVSRGLEGSGGSLKNVQRRACDAPLRKNLDQCGFVDDRPARHVDEIGGRFHQAQAVGIQKAPRRLVQEAGDDDEIGNLEEIVEFGELGARLRCGALVDVRIGGENRHSVGLHPTDQLSSDAPKSDNAKRAPWQSDARMIRAFAPSAPRAPVAI